MQEIHEGLDFSVDDDSEYSFGIFSVKFSTDGRELVAASSDDSIYVYDLQENKLYLRIPSHEVVIFIFCWPSDATVIRGLDIVLVNEGLDLVLGTKNSQENAENTRNIRN